MDRRWEMMRAHRALIRAMATGREELGGFLDERFVGVINRRQYDTAGFLDAIDRIRRQFPGYGVLVSRRIYEPVSQSNLLVARYRITLKGVDVVCKDELRFDQRKVCRYKHLSPAVASAVLG